MNPANKIQETIRRLLRLGESSNRNEAEAALAKAAELARRHSIDLGSIKAEEARAAIIEKTFESKVAFDEVERAAVQLCMSMFKVECVYTRADATYIGLEHNVAAAVWAHSFIMEQCGRDLKAFRSLQFKATRRRLSVTATRSYCMGWVVAIHRKHKAESVQKQAAENPSVALVLREHDQELRRYMDEKHATVRKARSRKPPTDSAAIRHGYADGSKINLSRPIEQSAEPRFALTA